MWKLVMVVALLGNGFWFSLTGIERKLAYPFDQTRVAPADVGLPQVREVRLRTGLVTLILWVAPPKNGQPTILYFQGNAGNLANRADRFAKLTARGYGLIAPAYRGSSGSTGRPSEPNLTRDAVLVWSQLGALIPGLTGEHVVLYGESLGTALGVKLLAQPGIVQPAGVVLEASFTSYPDVARHSAPELAHLIDRMRNVWRTEAHVKTLRAPLLMLHGTADTLVPIDQGRQVFAAAPSETKQFLTVQGASHSDLWRADTLEVLWAFIDGLQSDSIR